MKYSKGKTTEIANNFNENFGKRYLSIAEAAEYTGLSKCTLWRITKTGQLVKIKIGSAKNGKVLYDRENIDQWLKRNIVTINPTEENL